MADKAKDKGSVDRLARADGQAARRTVQDILETAARERMGFLTAADVDRLAECDATRLFQCLIRFDGCRCVAAAQDVAHIIHALERAGDGCRDVSIPADRCQLIRCGAVRYREE